jgi:hypothetical protein
VGQNGPVISRREALRWRGELRIGGRSGPLIIRSAVPGGKGGAVRAGRAWARHPPVRAWDYGANHIQIAAAKRPTNQTTETKNSQSSRVMRPESRGPKVRSPCVRGMRLTPPSVSFWCMARGYSGILPVKSCYQVPTSWEFVPERKKCQRTSFELRNALGVKPVQRAKACEKELISL